VLIVPSRQIQADQLLFIPLDPGLFNHFKSMFYRFFWTTMFLVATSQYSAAMEPHPHQGKVAPFSPGDPKVNLDKEALEILESGKPYQTQMQSGASGRGLVVQDIHAPTDIVWGLILDYDHYADMVPKTIESKNYDVQKHRGKDHRQTIFTEMKVGFPMVKLQFFVQHEYYPNLNSLTWTLDYSKKSDFDDSCGYWYVIPHPTKQDWTRVYYSVEVSMFDWVPKFVVQFMSKQALTEATGWVRKFSELEYAKVPKKNILEESSEVEPPKKKRKWGLFSKKQNKQDDDSVCSTDTCSLTESDDSSASFANNDNVKSITTKVLPKIGLSRYVLVASVFGLSMYNVHLYFVA
jgi:hypothetical protein